MTIAIADAQLREARAALRTERTRTTAERDAFTRFIHQVDAIESAPQQTPLPSHSSLASPPAIGAHVSADGLQQVRDAYRETIMAVSHYEAEYDESLRENLAAEFGNDVATAVCETAQLTPPLRHALVQKGREAYHDRTKLLNALDDEDDQLIAAREQLTDIGVECKRVERGIGNKPSAQLSFPEVYEAWHRLRDLEAECTRLLADRQHFVHETGTFGQLDATAFYDYLYESLDVTYPILIAGTDLCDRLHAAKHRTTRELTQHA